METKENVLSRVLGDLGLQDLPTSENSGNSNQIWTKAIALVVKKSGSESYALLKRDERLNQLIVKDYGEESAIFQIKEIYPYEFLQNKFIQGFKDNDVEQRREYLKFLNLPYLNSIDTLSLDELNKEIVCAAIYLQDLDSKGKSRNEEVQNYRNENIVKQNDIEEEPEEEKQEEVEEPKEEPVKEEKEEPQQELFKPTPIVETKSRGRKTNKMEPVFDKEEEVINEK